MASTAAAEATCLVKCWSTVRTMIRTMYKDGLRDNMTTGGGVHVDSEQMSNIIRL